MPRRGYKAKPAARRPIKVKPRSVAIVGTGLIGATIGLASRAAGFDVAGWDTDKRALRSARRVGAL
ncbi:MAG TPA: 3-hydroxyacyl-CoA dehydrogenase NAD-binding domain-containing protein, partial [Candidatus Eremiobacteraceae bacterium]|nr:3-hydroxyacyl-CoA dehydrogenase NAD-binding domain-containing protein [Candidatus Eremiobacteraceae bacterium]